MVPRASYEVLWLPEGEDGAGQPTPIRVWKTIRFVEIGEAYRVAFSSGPLTTPAGPRKTTLIQAKATRVHSVPSSGCYELTAVQTEKAEGESVYVMRRIA